MIVAFATIADQQNTTSTTPVLSKSVNLPTVNVATTTYKYIGNKKTKVYHKINCRYVKTIKKSHMVYFKTKSQAKKAGYRPCKVCKP